MKILHLVPGLSNPANGIAVAAKLVASAQGADVRDCREVKDCKSAYDEVWVHSMWTAQVRRACRAVLKAGKPLVRMPHACLDPLRVRFHGWRKALVAPFERGLYARASRVAVTGEWERSWCEAWGVKGPFEIVDLKRHFNLHRSGGLQPAPAARPLHLLYLGRRHPLKGLDVLEAAVAAVSAGAPGTGAHPQPAELSIGPSSNRPVGQDAPETIKQSPDQTILLRVVGDAFGEEKEKVWDWCDVLVLPTLSENFGLVVAEALERGKRVITTDGAPAWEDQPGVVYLKGFRDGTPERRVELLASALVDMCAGRDGAGAR